jgi:hypothetical protein
MSGPVPNNNRHTAAQATQALNDSVLLVGQVTDLINGITKNMPTTVNKKLKTALETIGEFHEDGGRIQPMPALTLTGKVAELNMAIDSKASSGAKEVFPADLDKNSLRSASLELHQRLEGSTELGIDVLGAQLRDLALKISGPDYSNFQKDIESLIHDINHNIAAVTQSRLTPLIETANGLDGTLGTDPAINRQVSDLNKYFEDSLLKNAAAIQSLPQVTQIYLKALGTAVKQMEQGADCTKVLSEDLGKKLTVLASGRISSELSPADLISETRKLTQKIDEDRKFMENNPPSTGVGKNNRLSITSLAEREKQLMVLHDAIYKLVLGEDKVLENYVKGIANGAVRQYLGDDRADFIKTIKELDQSMHKLVKLTYSQYPAIKDYNGTWKKLGESHIQQHLKSYNSIDKYAQFSPIETLMMFHAHGWINLSALNLSGDKLAFTFNGQYTPIETAVEGSPPGIKRVLPTLGTTAILGAIRGLLAYEMIPVSLFPATAITASASLFASALLFVNTKGVFAARFDTTLARDAQGNATQPDDIVSRIIVGIQSVKKIADQCGSLKPEVLTKDSTTVKSINAHELLTKQLIKALGIAVERFDELGDQNSMKAGASRKPVEDAIGEAVKIKDAAWNVWSMKQKISLFINGPLGLFDGILPGLGYLFGK